MTLHRLVVSWRLALGGERGEPSVGEMVGVRCAGCGLREEVWLGVGMHSTVTAMGCRSCSKIRHSWTSDLLVELELELDPDLLVELEPLCDDEAAAQLRCPDCGGRDVYELLVTPDFEQVEGSSTGWSCPSCDADLLSDGMCGLWD